MPFKNKEQVVSSAQEKVNAWVAFEDLNRREKKIYKDYLDTQQKQEEQANIEEQILNEDIVTGQSKENIDKIQEEVSTSQQLLLIKSQLKQTEKELNKAKNWQWNTVKDVVKIYFKELFQKIYNRIDATTSWKYSHLDKNHIAWLIAKSNTLLANAKDYKSQLVTGDLDEAKRFMPPNIFDDASFYIPDVKKWDFDNKKDISIAQKESTPVVCDNTNKVIEHDGTLWEQFAENGVLWALNAWLEKAWAGPEMRSRAYKVGNLVRWATKLFWWIRAGWNFLKSSFNAAFKWWSFADVAKYWSILVWWYVLWPSIDKLVRWWDTSRQAAEIFWASVGKTPAEIKENTQDTELNIDAKISAELFKDIPRKDWKEFTNEQWAIDFEKFKWYLLEKDELEGTRYKALQEIEQSNSLWRIQNFLTGMGINGLYITQKIKNNPDETITKTYEEAKKRWDEVAETYNWEDSAKVRPMIETIDAEMVKNNDPSYTSFKEKKMDIEKELNILYIKHENARPIKITYNTTSKQVEIESYQQKSILELWNTPGIQTSYTTESRKTTDHNEAIRINNLVNFLTAPQNQLINRSQVDKPFHESSIKWDIEFEKANRRESFKQLNRDWNLKDISVLNDSFRSPRFKELYPSIANDKTEFINRLNSLKKSNGTSLWKA